MKNIFTLFLIISLLLSVGATAQTRPKTWAQPVSTYEFKNIYKVNDSIYRSEQPSQYGFEEVCELKIKSVLNLRLDQTDKGSPDCRLKLIQVKMDPDHFTEADVVNALKALKNSPKPLLVHCFYGSDRTGMIIALYRIVYQNWSKEEALNEMVNGGYGFHKSYVNMINYVKNVNVASLKAKLK